MFDIGFPELLIVSVVALLVIGPERLPETVRAVALWVGRFKRMVSNVKAELEQEIGADEIRRQIHNEEIMRQLEAAKQDVNGIMTEANETVSELKNSVDPKQLSKSLNPGEVKKPTEQSSAPSTPEATPDPLTDQATERDEREQRSESGG